MKFSKKLITWYLQNKRTMPWRETTNPYYIWLSEIILQQTRVAQGLPYYQSFVKTYPTVFDLASAKEEQVLKLWQGLGYYSRARNLHTTAKYVANELNGVFPDTYKGLLQLKGVGDYTASAIASICYNEPVPVVDGNVYRVLSRYFNINTAINTTQGIKEFKKLAVQLIDTEEPAVYNQAIMEFGALQCKPKSPYCIVCPLNDSCEGLMKGTVPSLPVKLKKVNIKKRYFNYLIFVINDSQTIIRKRTGKGIWQNLYEFKVLESDREIGIDEVKKDVFFQKNIEQSVYTIIHYQEADVLHKLSHQHLYTKFFIIKTTEKPVLSANEELINIKDITQYPVPIVLGNFIDRFF